MYRDAASVEPELVVTAIGKEVIAIRTLDGGEAWRANVGGHFSRLHVTATRVLAVGERLTIFELTSGRVVGRIDVGGGTLLVVGDLAFVSSHGSLRCVELDAGKVRWTHAKLPYGAAALAVPDIATQADLG